MSLSGQRHVVSNSGDTEKRKTHSGSEIFCTDGN